MVKNRPRHIKLQGFSGAGKSTWGLTFFSHHAADVAPEAALMCIIDCDLEGQADLVARDDIVPPNLRSRILRKVCRTPDEVNDISLAFIDLMRQHQEEHPDGVRVMVMENEGAYYLSCREHYAVSVHGKSEGELLLSRQQEAISQGKKTYLPMQRVRCTPTRSSTNSSIRHTRGSRLAVRCITTTSYRPCYSRLRQRTTAHQTRTVLCWPQVVLI